MRIELLTCALIVLAMGCWGCGSTPEPVPEPEVGRVLPAKAHPAETVSLWGNNLGTQGTLRIGEKEIKSKFWSNTRIELVLPERLPFGNQKIEIEIPGKEGAKLRTTADVEVLRPRPSVTEVQPMRSKVGEFVTVTGSNFGEKDPNSAVIFYGSEAKEIASWKPTEIKFKIPPFDEYGVVQVRVGDSVSNGIGYRLIKPTLSSFEPEKVLRGKNMSIIGTDFGTVPGTVVMGGTDKRADIVSWTDKKIEVTVPKDLETGPEVLIRVANQNGPSFPSTVNVMRLPSNGGIWTTKKDSRFACLVLDDDGIPDVLWYESTTGCPFFTRWNGNSWDPLAIRTGPDPLTRIIPNIGWYPSMARGPDGAVHVTCYNVFSQQLVYAILGKGADDWAIEYPDKKAKNIGINSCVRVNKDGTVFIAYFEQGTGYLKLARGKPGNWKFEVVDSSPQVGLSVSMDFDPEGKPHFAYLDFANKQLKYAYPSGATYKAEHITGEPSKELHTHRGPPHGPAAPSLRIDAKGVPHVAFLYRQGDLPKKKPEDADGLQYGTRVDGKWKLTVVDTGEEIGFCPQLAIGKDQRIHVTYLSRKDQTVRYALSDPSGKWKIAKNDRPSLWALEEPGGAAMQLGPDDKPRVVCWTETRDKHTVIYETLEPPK